MVQEKKTDSFDHHHHHQDVTSRTKAAAWAWYQRSGGAPAPLGRSHAFLTRHSACHSPSRFLLEALNSRTNMASPSSTASFVDVPSTFHDEPLNFHHTWDCGSSLFDSFELVAMSKQLDVELSEPPYSHHPVVDPLPSQPAAQFLPLTSPKHPTFRPLVQPPAYDELDHDAFVDKFPYHGSALRKKSDGDKYSKQAVYDMLCHFTYLDKTSKHGKSDFPGPDCEIKKQKSKHRSSLHSLSKALQHIAHLAHPGDDHHREQHHHHKDIPFLDSSSKSLQKNTHTSAPFRAGDEHEGSLFSPRHQYQHKHVHHHHHHHYHYLFHSDDGFTLQPQDKSLMVAAAGLRTPKMSPLPGCFPLEIPRLDAMEHRRGGDG